mgnify:CR=1 FL=1
MPITIKNRWTDEPIATLEDTDSLREAVIRLVGKGVDLRGSDLRGSDLRGSDLSGSNLSGSNLRGSNLRDVPIVPQLHTRILEAIEAGGTLDMGVWHTCETTHCRGGWSIHLAGQAGYDLERRAGIAVAAALIHIASCPQLGGKVPNFCDTNKDAMADIKRLAAIETAVVS